MSLPYAHIADLAEVVEIPRDGTLSRTVYSDASIKVVMFGFDTGQELSEHTSSRPALLQIIRGQAQLTLGGDAFDAQDGFWAHMDAGLSHSVRAMSPMVMALVLLPPVEGEETS